MGRDDTRLSQGTGNFRRSEEVMILHVTLWEQDNLAQLGSAGPPQSLTSFWSYFLSCGKGCARAPSLLPVNLQQGYIACSHFCDNIPLGNSQIELVSWTWVQTASMGRSYRRTRGHPGASPFYRQHSIFVQGRRLFWESDIWMILKYLFPSCIKLHSRAGF